MSIISYIFPQTIAEFHSEFNGKIIIKEAFGCKYIEVGGLMQSGRIPEKLFRQGFRKLKLQEMYAGSPRILVLGVGGGTVLKILTEVFPKAKLTAVDIDPIIIEAGKKHLESLKISTAKIIIGDVFNKKTSLGKNYDVIIVDLFRGYEIPQELSNRKFLTQLRGMLRKNACVIFNRLYFQKYKNEADVFLDKVKEVFQDVVVYRNYFNILIRAKL